MTTLSQLVRVPARFHRSVHLPQDHARGDGPGDSYLVTPAIREAAEQVLHELDRPRGARAWTLTGPFGSGKSAFLLFLADLLGRTDPKHPEARRLRRELLPGGTVLRPVTIQADAGPLQPALRAALSRRKDSRTDCATLLQREAKSAGGLLLLVDELGKFLEHAARSDEDPFLLQQLAEAAARSEAPVVFLGALHSGFSRYLGEAGGGPERRAEWRKVEGRFHDLPFALPDSQALDLLGRAVEWKGGKGRRWTAGARKTALAAGRTDAEAKRLAACAPLHPLTALLLWPLFRSRAAQNERSLFSFLTSHEPHGFRDFLDRTTVPANGSAPPLYRLPALWDYAAGSLGSAAFAGADGRKWGLAADALDRLDGAAPPLAAEVVKATALLDLFGTRAGLAADQRTLQAALDDTAVPEAIDWLKDRSVLVWRRHRSAWALWEGSDLDLDEALRRALGERGAEPLAQRLARVAAPRPLAARAHAARIGTPRWFESRLAGASDEEIQQALTDPTEADGIVLFLVPEAGRQPRDIAPKTRDSKPLLTAVLHGGSELAEGLAEVEGWQRVRESTPELAGDAAARREAEGREEAARRRFESVAGPALGLAGHVLDPRRADWYDRGRKQTVKRPQDLQRLLSRLCDEAYPKAPRLDNELLNRRTLSSAAAAGRRNLIARILEERLDFEGCPPEFSMFLSLVEQGGFVGRQGLKAPTGDWTPVWDEVKKFVGESRDAPRSVAALAARLEAPPFGLRPGPFPVLLALFLRVAGGKAALYEDGVFLPDRDTAAFERLLRRPETFALRSFRAELGEKQLLQKICTKFGLSTRGDFDELLIRCAQHIVGRAVRLPPFARQTARVSGPARRVRDALLAARDPRDLFLRDLPPATGLDADDPAFPRRLREAVEEVEGAFDRMLASLETAAREGFGFHGDNLGRRFAEAGRELRDRAPDPRLRLVLEAAVRAGETDDWQRTIAPSLADGLPPERWNDDQADFAAARVRNAGREVAQLTALNLGSPANGDPQAETLLRCWQKAAKSYPEAVQREAWELLSERFVGSGVSP